MARLGSNVTLVHRGSQLLTGEDPEVSATLTETLENEGVTVLVESEVTELTSQGSQRIARVTYRGVDRMCEYDEVLVTIGREPRTSGFGLEQLGVDLKRDQVNAFLQTSLPHIYVVGDALGRYQFTHAASHEAWHAAVNSLFGHVKKIRVDYNYLPWVIYTDPEIARVGLNRRQAQSQNIDVEVTRYNLNNLDRAIAEAKTTGYVEVLTVPGRDKILGATVVGSHGGEIISSLTLAMKNNLGLSKMLATIHAYPGWSEATKSTAGHWKNSNKPEKLLRWARKYHTRRRG